MARVRKSLDKTKQILALWKAALYIRLSREDGNDESYSVKNQRQRLNEFLENLMLEEEIQLVDIYIDDGYTGTDSDRENFQRMLEDIDKGIVNCVIVKDLSRLSRNDWECKKYLQHLFVVKDVRFISLQLPKLDSYKNPDEVYEMGVSIQSMYNENHCRETSIKVRGTFNMKRKKGEFIGAFAPYGYLKDPDNKHRLIVDNETAPIVQDIFHWFVRDGMSKNGIVKKLIMGTPCPAAYKRQNGMKYHNPAIVNNETLWSARSITAILTNQMYLGHMVQGKQKVKSYKVHTRINTPESEQFIVEDTPQGPEGPQGPPGTTVTDNSMFAANTTGGTISVILGGTLVPLADSQVLDDFTVNANDTVFTVPETGTYYISYDINLTAGALLQSMILINGVANAASTRSPLLSLSNYSAEIIVNLTAGDTILLQLAGLLGLVVLENGAGASLSIIRLVQRVT